MASSASALTSFAQSPALGAAAKAMGELGVAGCIGAAYVHRKMITPEMVRALSKTIYTILLPMFIGTNLMKTVTSQGGTIGRSALCVPLLAVLQSAILFILASKILIPLFGMDPKSEEGKVLAVTCCFGNAGVLPFVFAEAMFRENAGLLQEAFSQVSFFSAGWSPFFWSFVPKMLKISVSKDPASSTAAPPIAKLMQEIKIFFPPPVIGVVVGLTLGLSPLSPLLLSANSADKKPPLSVIFNSFQNLGKAASPLAVLVLTCSLAFGAGKKLQSSSNATTTMAGPLRKWACVSAARFLLSPLVMMGLLQGMAAAGMIGAPKAEPMLWFICLLQSIMPPAQNSVVLLQVAGRSDEASQMAKFLFSIYATAMLPIVGLVTASLQSLDIVP